MDAILLLKIQILIRVYYENSVIENVEFAFLQSKIICCILHSNIFNLYSLYAIAEDDI